MNSECWTEIDLYWFQGSETGEKVKELFDRLTPFWCRSPGARKGLSVCAGWLFDSVLYWNDRPDDIIATCQAPIYEAWSYKRLKGLIAALKREASGRKIGNFHIGLILLGGMTMVYDPENTCEGWGGRTEEVKERAHYNIAGKWFYSHPEIDFARYGTPFFGSKVSIPKDENVCHLKEPSFGEYFADKLCGMCAYTEFDAVILRDAVFSPAYIRGKSSRYMKPEYRDDLNGSFISLFARIKSLLPEFIIIGYSSGTSSVEEWRSHGFDLEKVAGSGYLDLWITQTWASAWQDYWPAHSMGYTFQLSNLLVNLAMLSGTPCGHMFLTETFDAWEPWDSVHQYPGKVSWEIWAYSHAAVKMPDGRLKRSSGSYISWMNRGNELIPEETVRYLRSVMEKSAADISKDPVPGGPCMIYHRKGLEYLMNCPGSFSHGEETDDWVAMLQKYGTPALSITRSEWLGKVDADAFIFSAPAGTDGILEQILIHKINSGTPVLFTGQAGFISESLKTALGIGTEENAVTCDFPSAAEVEKALGREIGTYGLQIRQLRRTLKESPYWDSLISCMGGPVFAKHKDKPCFIWETPEWGTPTELHLTYKSIGSPQTYLAVSHSFGKNGWGSEGIKWTNADWQKPVCFLFWRYEDGGAAALLGNLETGATGNSQFAVKGVLNILGSADYGCRGTEDFGPGYIKQAESGFYIAMAPHKACMVSITRR